MEILYQPHELFPQVEVEHIWVEDRENCETGILKLSSPYEGEHDHTWLVLDGEEGIFYIPMKAIKYLPKIVP